MPEELEIDVAELERELRDGADVVVIDTRSPDAFAAWHVQEGRHPVINIPEAELAADPGRARALAAGGTALRCMCNSGGSSLRSAQALVAAGVPARSVRGGLIAWSRLLQRSEVPVAGTWTVVQFRREARGCLSYLIAAGGEAVVVDPAPVVDAYVDEAERRSVRIVRVFDTHVHADHVSGARELCARTGATLSLPLAALARGVQFADGVAPVADGDRIPVGGQSLEVVALPGHTSDMTGLLVGEAALVGGDSLFADSVARPDLEAGDTGASDAARILHGTLHGRIGELPGSTVLLPCHWAGGRLAGPLAAPLADVQREVPELTLPEDAFVERILGQMPPKPSNFVSIIAVNLGDELPADEVARLEVGANNCAAKVEWASPAGAAPAAAPGAAR